MFARPRFLASGIALLAIVAAVGFGGWYFFIRDDSPEPVSLGAAVEAVRDQSAAATPAASEGGTAINTPAPTATDVATSDDGSASYSSDTASVLEGSWVVYPLLGSFVGYQVDEELANIGFQTAVGRTSVVDGALEVGGTSITGVTIEADMTSLQSDESRRDRALRTQGIQTSQFPTASFVLTQPITFGTVPAEGEAVSATAVGELTLHGVAQAVELAIEGQLVDGVIAVVGSLPIEFADYDISAPTAFSVISIEDRGVMEFQLFFVRASPANRGSVLPQRHHDLVVARGEVTRVGGLLDRAERRCDLASAL